MRHRHAKAESNISLLKKFVEAYTCDLRLHLRLRLQVRLRLHLGLQVRLRLHLGLQVRLRLHLGLQVPIGAFTLSAYTPHVSPT